MDRTVKKTFTTIRIPIQLRKNIDTILELTGEPLFWFEYQAVEKFIAENRKVEEKFKNSKYSDIKHIKRNAVLPLYLEINLMNRLDAYKEKIKEKKSNCVLQALEDLCVERARVIGTEIDLNYGEVVQDE